MLSTQVCLADKGYQGIAKLHPCSCIPIKKPRKGKLSKAERRHYPHASKRAGSG